jgi:hypothetical protein
MPFEVVSTHVYALIRCKCGEYIALSGERTVEASERCDSCGSRYILVAQVIDASDTKPELVLEDVIRA